MLRFAEIKCVLIMARLCLVRDPVLAMLCPEAHPRIVPPPGNHLVQAGFKKTAFRKSDN